MRQVIEASEISHACCPVVFFADMCYVLLIFYLYDLVKILIVSIGSIGISVPSFEEALEEKVRPVRL